MILFAPLQKTYGKTPHVSTPTPMPENPAMVQRLSNLIHDEKCVLPCWWGWTVGEDTLESIQEIAMANLDRQFDVFASKAKFFRIGMVFPEAEAPIALDDSYTGVSIVLWLHQEDNSLSAVSTWVSSPSESYVDTSPYQPVEILKTYGVPDQITIIYPTDIGGYTYSYYLKFKYHSLGLYIGYWMYIDTAPKGTDENISLCSSDYIGRIVLWVEPQELDLSEQMILSGGINRLTDPLDREIDGIVGMDLEAFTEAFSQEDTCIETLPINEWPADN